MSERPPVLQAVEALQDCVTEAHTLAHAFFEAGGENPSSMSCVWDTKMREMLALADQAQIEVRRHLGGEFA